jgi:hypothetical protein
MMNRNVYGKLAVLVAVLLLVALPSYAATECEDSPEVVVLPDCTTVEVTTCYCDVNPAGDTLEITVVVGDTVDEGTPDLDGEECVLDGNLAEDVTIDDVVPRQGMKNGNSTPAPKGTTDITCTDCPETTVSVDLGESAKKNSHFDILLMDGDDNPIGKVGFNTHTQACEVEPD